MKFAFTTCVQLGRSVIERVYEMGGAFEFLVTLNDDKAKNKSGRVYLDDISERHNVPLIKVNSINDHVLIQAIKENNVDWLFIIGWSQIAKQELLDAPNKGCIGMHPTLLPEGRGRAAIPWAILKELKQTGVTMFKLDGGVDTGDILGQVVIPLFPGITATEVYEKVNDAHLSLIEKYWDSLVSDTVKFEKQNEARATEWPGRHPEDGELKHEMTLCEAEKMVRAVTHPYPGAYYFTENNVKIIVWSAKTSDHAESGLFFKCKDGYLIPIKYTKDKK